MGSCTHVANTHCRFYTFTTNVCHLHLKRYAAYQYQHDNFLHAFVLSSGTQQAPTPEVQVVLEIPFEDQEGAYVHSFHFYLAIYILQLFYIVQSWYTKQFFKASLICGFSSVLWTGLEFLNQFYTLILCYTTIYFFVLPLQTVQLCQSASGSEGGRE